MAKTEKVVKYLVIKEELCGDCGGTGMVEDPFWTRYFEANPNRELTPEQYGAQQGFDPDNLPPQEVRCANCHGEGKVRTEVDLLEALEAIAAVQI